MLLAPIVLDEPSRPARSRRFAVGASRERAELRMRRIALAWLGAGALAWLMLPALRGGPLVGASGAFWLIGAPLIDLAWLARRDIARSLRSAFAPRAATRGARRVSVQRAARGARSAWISGDAERSSSV